ncbi:MAG: CDP-glucose 4,6-dehydratase [Rhodospirillales bacterium CG15_BIG_FIL_POST_REV_8_21_14_020_66_15]|nr:MAG: CDP-glucose 4,6-dehydratase [Rhodospirillales bacterium CG15_BIG_FIL_POST_REV_8_21_14_020_66_15]
MTDFSQLKGRRVLVTGSTGFKGSWLCAWLTDLGAEVTGLALPPKEDAPLYGQLRLADRIDQHFVDIRDYAAVAGLLERAAPEVIIHLAAQALVRRSYAEPMETFHTNVTGGINLLEAVRLTPSVRCLVFITSDKCYRNKEWEHGYHEDDVLGGPDPYSASKGAVELVFSGYQDSFFRARDGLIAATARAGNVIGGGDMAMDRIVPDCIRALRAGKPVVVRNPTATRPWQHVLEPLSGYLTLAVRQLADDDTAAGAWNFGPDPENVRPVQELAETAVGAWGAGEVRVQRDPDAPHEATLLMLDSTKAKQGLGWRPRWDFTSGITRTVDWYRAVDGGADPVDVTRRQIAEYDAA